MALIGLLPPASAPPAGCGGIGVITVMIVAAIVTAVLTAWGWL